MTVVLRPATLADQPELQRMTKAFLEATIYGRLLRYNEDQVASLIVTVLERGIIYVLEAANAQGPHHCAGMLALVCFPHPIAGDPYVEEVCWWVDPEYRKGDLGHNLLRAGIYWARQKGAVMLKMVAPHGSPVERLYRQVGLEPFETAWVLRL